MGDGGVPGPANSNDNDDAPSLVLESAELRALMSALTLPKRSSDNGSVSTGAGDGADGRDDNDGAQATTCDRVREVVDRYQEQGSLLDPLLVELSRALSLVALRAPEEEGRPRTARAAFRALYTLCKVRGYKTVSKVLPNEVELFEQVARRLLSTEEDAQHWEQRYCLLIWLRTLSMLPFPIVSMDSSEGGRTLSSELIDRAKRILLESGRPKEGAAAFLSQFVSRKDTREELRALILWCLEDGTAQEHADLGDGDMKTETTTTGRGSTPSPVVASRTLAGRWYLLAKILKHGTRSELRELVAPHHGKILAAEWAVPRTVDGGIDPAGDRLSSSASTASTLTSLDRLYRLKLVQRMGLLLLAPRVTTWRYRRGARLLFQGKAVSSASGGKKPGAEEVGGEVGSEDGCDWWLSLEDAEVASVEDVIDLLLESMRDRDTKVRWSVAKGLGRVTSRLPQVLAVEVSAAVLAVASVDRFLEDSMWHGACMTLAELARRGLLLPSDGMLDSLVKVVTRALRFDVQRGSVSVGAQVRDAACYVCWALARAYSSEDFGPFAHSLARSLLPVALLDREVNCRRAASAALQECIGRFASGLIPHGLALLPLVDFYALADRKATYLTVTPTVARLRGKDEDDEDDDFEKKEQGDSAQRYHLSGNLCFYLDPLLDELVERKLRHWDEHVRELASQSMGRVLAEPGLDPDVVTNVLSTLMTRLRTSVTDIDLHGALLGIARACPSLAEEDALITGAIRSLFVQEEDATEDAAGTTGSGRRWWRLPRTGSREMKLGGICQLIGSLGRQNLIEACVTDMVFSCFVAEALASPLEKLQRDGCFAAVGLAMVSKTARAHVVLWIQANMLTMPGCVLAACEFPSKDIATEALVVLRAGKTPELRRNAANAIGTFGAGGWQDSVLDPNVALPALLEACNDYEIDSRGDVGSWVREAAMEAIKDVVPRVRTLDMVQHAAAVLTRQMLERLDRTREVAVRALTKLLETEPRLADVAAALPEGLSDPGATNAFRVAPQLLSVEVLRKSALLGLTASAGGTGKQASLATSVLTQEATVDELLSLYTRARSDKRQALSLLTSLQTLVAEREPEDGPWTLECANEVCADLRGSRDLMRLDSTIKLLTNLATYELARKRSLRALTLLLCHRIPCVRRQAAASLFTHTLLVDDYDQSEWLQTTLTDTQWEFLSTAELKAVREQIAAAMSVRDHP